MTAVTTKLNTKYAVVITLRLTGGRQTVEYLPSLLVLHHYAVCAERNGYACNAENTRHHPVVHECLDQSFGYFETFGERRVYGVDLNVRKEQNIKQKYYKRSKQREKHRHTVFQKHFETAFYYASEGEQIVPEFGSQFFHTPPPSSFLPVARRNTSSISPLTTSKSPARSGCAITKSRAAAVSFVFMR